jgi:hypothetical protein
LWLSHQYPICIPPLPHSYTYHILIFVGTHKVIMWRAFRSVEVIGNFCLNIKIINRNVFARSIKLYFARASRTFQHHLRARSRTHTYRFDP